MAKVRAPARIGLARTYLLFFFATVAVNLVLLIFCTVFDQRGNFFLAAASNMLVAVLVRNEVFLNSLYFVLVRSFRSPRVSTAIKNDVTAGLLYIGGVHAGCGAAAVIWLAAAFLNSLSEASGPRHWAVIALSSALLLQVFGVCILAIPSIRREKHNLFEYTHRFLGWSALLVFWAITLVSIHWPTPQAIKGKLSLELASKSPSFWLTIIVTCLILSPWLVVRKVRVRSRVRSPQVIEIEFPGASAVGSFGRISRHLLSDWHSFALVPKVGLVASHTMLISRAGDFTSELIVAPPAALYVRKVSYPGLPYCVPLYQRSVIIASGAGMAPYVSLLSMEPPGKQRLIWIGRSFRESFGDTLCDAIFEWPDVVLVDTTRSGRPDLVALAVGNYRSFGAEVVFVGSNPEATRQIVSGCHALGIPAFGPSWDS
jgi:hypothetical protein